MTACDTSVLLSDMLPDVNHKAARRLFESIESGAKTFWTFDDRQRRLAKAAGLQVNPDP